MSSEPAELKCESEIKLLWVKIQNKGIPDLYIGSFYKPPNMTDESIIQELDKSIYRVKQSPNSHIWLGDDFNLGGINWENGSIRPKASNTKQCKQLLDICHDHALEQMVRDRPFNLWGWGLWFFVSFRNFISDNTRVRIFFFFVI